MRIIPKPFCSSRKLITWVHPVAVVGNPATYKSPWKSLVSLTNSKEGSREWPPWQNAVSYGEGTLLVPMQWFALTLVRVVCFLPQHSELCMAHPDWQGPDKPMDEPEFSVTGFPGNTMQWVELDKSHCGLFLHTIRGAYEQKTQLWPHPHQGTKKRRKRREE